MNPETAREMNDAEYADFERREAIDFARARFIAFRGKPAEELFDGLGNQLQKFHPDWSVETIVSVLEEAKDTTQGDPKRVVDEDLLNCPSAKDAGIQVCGWGIPHVDGRRAHLDLYFYKNPKRKRATLIKRYRINGKTYYPNYFLMARAIAEMNRAEPKDLAEKVCQQCGNAFFLKPKGQKAKFCSIRCRKMAYKGAGTIRG